MSSKVLFRSSFHLNPRSNSNRVCSPLGSRGVVRRPLLSLRGYAMGHDLTSEGGPYQSQTRAVGNAG